MYKHKCLNLVKTKYPINGFGIERFQIIYKLRGFDLIKVYLTIPSGDNIFFIIRISAL